MSQFLNEPMPVSLVYSNISGFANHYGGSNFPEFSPQSVVALFEENLKKIARRVHDASGLLYYDRNILKAIAHIAKSDYTGVDVVQLNLDKTFSTPHDGSISGLANDLVLVPVSNQAESYPRGHLLKKHNQSYFERQPYRDCEL